jgi:hypothetical protein
MGAVSKQLVEGGRELEFVWGDSESFDVSARGALYSVRATVLGCLPLHKMRSTNN